MGRNTKARQRFFFGFGIGFFFLSLAPRCSLLKKISFLFLSLSSSFAFLVSFPALANRRRRLRQSINQSIIPQLKRQHTPSPPSLSRLEKNKALSKGAKFFFLKKGGGETSGTFSALSFALATPQPPPLSRSERELVGEGRGRREIKQGIRRRKGKGGGGLSASRGGSSKQSKS